MKNYLRIHAAFGNIILWVIWNESKSNFMVVENVYSVAKIV